MRGYGTIHPTQFAPQPSDSVLTFLIAGSSGQASDWLSSAGSAVANAGAAGVFLVRLTGVSTTGALLNFYTNLYSTAAAAPSSGFAFGSTSANYPVQGQATYQVAGNSTGMSLAALSSGYVTVEYWRK